MASPTHFQNTCTQGLASTHNSTSEHKALKNWTSYQIEIWAFGNTCKTSPIYIVSVRRMSDLCIEVPSLLWGFVERRHFHSRPSRRVLLVQTIRNSGQKCEQLQNGVTQSQQFFQRYRHCIHTTLKRAIVHLSKIGWPENPLKKANQN